MKKQANIEDENLIAIIPEYGRQKLLGYAESFRDLAELFEEKEETEECRQDTTRQEYLLQKKLCENQGLLADHLKEMAHIMADVAQETYRYRPVGERRYRQIARMLKESGILLKNLFVLENEDEHMELSLVMKTESQENIVIEDVADLISVAMNMRIRASKNGPVFMTREWNAYHFLEEPTYHILTGVAKAVKETEKNSKFEI